MSDEISQENVHEYLVNKSDDDEEEEEEDYTWMDAYFPTHPPEDVIADIKLALERCPHDVSLQETVTKLTGKLNEDGFPEKLANGIIIYILECHSNGKTGLLLRIANAKDVMKSCPGSSVLVLNAVNTVLAADKLLKWIPSLNLFKFIGSCLDDNVFDGKDLRINKNESTSLQDVHTKELRHRISTNGRKNASFRKFVNRFRQIIAIIFCGRCNYF